MTCIFILFFCFFSDATVQKTVCVALCNLLQQQTNFVCFPFFISFPFISLQNMFCYPVVAITFTQEGHMTFCFRHHPCYITYVCHSIRQSAAVFENHLIFLTIFASFSLRICFYFGLIHFLLFVVIIILVIILYLILLLSFQLKNLCNCSSCHR